MIWPDLVRMALEHERADLIAEVSRAAAHIEQASGADGSIGYAARRIVALGARDMDAIAAAADGLSATARAVESAAALEEAGRAGASGDGAASYLMRSFDAYQALDASHDADRVRAALRGAGVRMGRRGTRDRPTSGWQALTPTELRIVEHVALGLTNSAIGERLFISRRTVQTHLRSVFDKLGVKSRAEVAAIAARRSGATQQPG